MKILRLYVAAAVGGACLMAALPAAAADGLVALTSPRPAKETMDRLEALVQARGLKVFARIDHAAGASTVGQALRPTELLIFGNPQGGTPMMLCAQTAGIDLPLKALVWQDASQQVWVGYNEPTFIAQRHGAADCPAVGALSKALTGLVEATVAP